MGVGVAPRPTRNEPAAYQQDKSARPAPQANKPQAAWDLSQDPSHPQASMHTPPPVPPQPSSSARRYNMTQSYVSSIHENTPPLRQQLPPRDSHYPEDDLSPRPAYPSSKIMPQFEFPTPTNRDTMDSVDSYDHSKTHPKPKLIDTSARPTTRPKPGEISPASTRANAMNALSQAIQVGISKPVSPATTQAFSPSMRMPFDNDTTSVHTLDLEPPDLRDAPPVPTANPNLRPPEASTSPKSATSESPILGLGIGAPARGMSTKRDATKRPPRLDIDAVRDMEARGSTTSLTDLIKRATKLASNLDRGKTASRLGMLDMFGPSGSSQRMGNLPPGKRDSSMSDMLSAFPAPAAGTPRSEWPTNEKGFMSSTTNLSRKKGDGSSSKHAKSGRRRICGMTIPCFTVVLIALILIIAAAVLIPIFLIVVPRQSSSSSTAAASSAACSRDDASKCQNGGTSVFTNGQCGCVCLDGFIGKNCETQGGNTCTTRDIADGSVIYRNATMSREVLQGFTDAGSFNVPLNATTILALFSQNAVTCADAGSLVDVNESNNNKRAAAPDPEPLPIVMIPGLEPSEVVNALHLPHPTAPPSPTTFIISKRQEATFSTPSSSSSSAMFEEVDGIVVDPAADTVVDTRTESASGRGTATSSGSAASATADSQASGSDISRQLAFSRVVVLYVLERSQALAVALDAKNRLSRYFATSGGNDEVNVGQISGQEMMVDMVRFTIRDGARTIGG